MVDILSWLNQYFTPIVAVVSVFIFLRPWFSRKISDLRSRNAKRINKKIQHYTQLKDNPKLFYSSILTHILVSFCVLGVALAFDSILLSSQQVKASLSWRILFGLMIYAVALNGVVSIKIITKDYDDIIEVLKKRLKKLEDKQTTKE